MATICSCCGEYAEPVMIDVGIGAYEYWGARGVDRNLQPLSRCCEAECVEGGVGEYTNCYRIAKKSYISESGETIQVGETYHHIVQFHWRKDGPTWIKNRRIKLKEKEVATCHN